MNFDDVTLAVAQRSNSLKWNRYAKDIIPSWIADMDFPVADPIKQYLSELAQTGDLCYAPAPPLDPVLEVFSERMSNRYGWMPHPEEMEVMTDIVQGLYIAVKVLCDDGEKVIVNMPSYHPILSACHDMKREMLESDLIKTDSGWKIDFDELENQIDGKTRLLLLVNPQNPTGKAFTKAELERFAELVLEHDLYVVSDEIHCDLIFSESGPHIPFASLSPEIAGRTVTFNSATKSHNLGGIRCSVAHYGSQVLRERFDRLPNGMRGGTNALGPRITQIAWQQCDDWVGAVVPYLQDNRDYMGHFLKEKLPRAKHIPNESTYLSWLDFSDYRLPDDPAKLFLKEGKVGAYSGKMFGTLGEGHIRLNFATSRSILEEKLNRIERVINH